ncbi:hypothetical protein AVEN_264701-1 [Araneus ventricosus]|uniref:Uncharacterized protein n=1 Tax=Araneus ventricosus TaxID=182803 RepID=A0A4Y2WFR7_ARAVE|nr:hypothetical protein AVEN_264701-1 [Araneus ventricosus]
MRTTPELSLPFPNFYTTPTGGHLILDGFNAHQTRLHVVSPVESGFEPGTLRPQTDIKVRKACRYSSAHGGFSSDPSSSSSLCSLDVISSKPINGGFSSDPSSSSSSCSVTSSHRNLSLKVNC